MRGFQGYSSIEDFINTLINFKFLLGKIMIMISLFIPSFISEYVYNDVQAIYTLFALFLCDVFTGSWVAIKEKKFNSFKFGRIVPAMILAFMTLSISYNLSKASDLYYYLPTILYSIITSQLFFSLIENCAKLGFIKREYIDLLKEKFDIRTWINKKDS